LLLQVDDANTSQHSEVSETGTLYYSQETETPDTMYQNMPEDSKAYVFKGHPAGWLELPSDVACDLKTRVRFLKRRGVQAPETWFFEVTLDGEPVEFEVRLGHWPDRTVRMATLRFSSGTGEVRFGTRPLDDGYWSGLS
jgi:hypothetical protein